MKRAKRLSGVLSLAGYLAMLAGAVDPLEGSLVVLVGGGLVALAALLGRSRRPLLVFRVAVFALLAAGVAALWSLSSVGGIGGPRGLSVVWGLLILPYPVGWSLAIWGPGSPRWVLWAGIGVGLWLVALLAFVLQRSGEPLGTALLATAVVIVATAVCTVCGCAYRLRKRGTG